MLKKIMWSALSQKRELKFHMRNTWRKTEEFPEQTAYLMETFGYSRSDFSGETIIDLGCGSKLRSKFFENANIIAIDPLADEFVKNIEWCDIGNAKKYHSKPAEEFIPELENVARFIMCINVLDHCFDTKNILANCCRYMKNDGEFLLSVDAHKKISSLHPIALNDVTLEKMFSELGFSIVRSYRGLGRIGPSYERSLDSTTLTYILKKSQ